MVDDGSTDETPDLLKSFGDALTVIRQENKGVSAARNRGIREAKGSLIAFLDSDDYFLPGKLECQAAFFDAHPEALICQTEEIWVRNGKRVNPKNRHKKPSGDIFLPSLELCLVSPSAVMLRKELLEEMNGFDETLPACEDYDLWLRIGANYPVYLIDTPLIVKRGGHGDQLSSAHSLDRYRIASLEKLLKGNLLPPDRAEAAAKVLVSKCRIYAEGCIKRGKQKEGEEYLARAEHHQAGPPGMESKP